MRYLSYGLLLIVVLLGLSFACLNATPVYINYYIGQVTTPLSWLLLMTFICGVVLGLLVSIINILKLKKTNAQLNYRIKMAEKELANLRVIPLKDTL